jgi:hypothetical protein
MHKFALSDLVTFTAEAGSYRERGIYEIAAHLPTNEEGDEQYRIRRIGGGGERVAREFQLTTAHAEEAELRPADRNLRKGRR